MAGPTVDIVAVRVLIVTVAYEQADLLFADLVARRDETRARWDARDSRCVVLGIDPNLIPPYYEASLGWANTTLDAVAGPERLR